MGIFSHWLCCILDNYYWNVLEVIFKMNIFPIEARQGGKTLTSILMIKLILQQRKSIVIALFELVGDHGIKIHER